MIHSHSVQFIDTQHKNISFDFKQLDVSCYIDSVINNGKSQFYILSQQDISSEFDITPKTFPKEEKEINQSDSITYTEKEATLYIPIDKFQNTFKLNVKQNQALKDNYSETRFYIDHENWSKDDFIIDFHNAYVKNEDSELVNVTTRHNQIIQYDVVRYIIIQKTGNISSSAFITNIDAMKKSVEQTVNDINNKIKELFTNHGGNKDYPIHYDVTDKNYSKDFLINILDSSVNIVRKKIMLNDLSRQINKYYQEHKEHKFFIKGTSFKGYGNYFPIYINKNHSDLFIGCTEIKFEEIEDMVFYMNPLTLNNNLENTNIPASYYNYDFSLDDYFMNVPFTYGDTFNFSMYITPPTDIKEITPLKYNIQMKMSLDSHVKIDVSDTNVTKAIDYLSFYNAEIQYNIPYLTLHYQDNEFFSPYSYYPCLGDISNILYKASIIQSYQPVDIKVTCRPTNDGTKYVFLFSLVPEHIQYDTFLEYSINEFKIYYDNTYYDYNSLIQISIPQEVSSYVHEPKINNIGDLQIMKIELVGENVNCKLKKMMIIMKDKKKIELNI
jgi:hypothetical protein